MASGVNVKMGVTGVAQFKQNINQAKQSVKTLEAQLALSEKQFKASGDAESYMTEKSELLKAKLEAQKSVVENAEKALKQMADKGVDRSSKAYQDMYRQMLSAKGQMIDTENEMNGIAAAGDNAAEGVEDMNNALRDVGKGINWQNVTEGLHSITSGMQKVMSKAWQMGEAIVKATLGAGSWADELKTTAAQMSTAEYTVTPEELQRMRKTANLIDTDVETIVAARSKLLKGLGNDTKATMSAMEVLGINTDGKSGIDLFWEAGDAIMKLGTDAEQEANATALFGKSWKELIPLFQAGREEYDKTMESWSVVENDQIDNLGKMDDQYQKLSGEWETFQNEILATFAGPLTTGMEKLTGFVQELNEYLDTPDGQAMIKQMGDTVTQLIEDLTKVNPEDVVNGLKGVVDGITGGLQWIAEHSSEVVGAVGAFIGAWGVAKTAEGITTVLKLINGIKGLSAGGAATGAASAGAAAGTAWASSFVNAVVSVAPALASILGITAVALTPALVANQKTFEQAEAQRSARIDAAGKLSSDNGWFLEASANALGYQRNANGELDKSIVGGVNLGNMDQIYSLLMGMNNRSDMQKAQLQTLLNGSVTSQGNYTWSELQKLWGGLEDFDGARMTAVLDSVADAYAKMSEETSDLTSSTDESSKASQEMSAAAKSMMDIPGLVGDAVRSGMSGITFVLDGSAITNYVDRQLGNKVNMARR